jgi:hypothetical protein
MSAVYVSNLIIDTGSNFNHVFFLDDFITNSSFNLSEYNIISQMRKWYGSSTYTDLQTEILDPSAGMIMISLTPEETILLSPGRYNYDVVMISPLGITTRVIEGFASVKQGVTR